jgi:dsDNA-specific endonuclease/ATPase MutS2
MARARYSTSLGATKPTFIDTDSQNLVRLQLKRARHPLLLQQHREALREAKAKLKSKSKVPNIFVIGASDVVWFAPRFLDQIRAFD